MIDTPAIEKLLGELEAATGLLPITCHDTPDYAEATGTDFIAMTMRPNAFMALNHLPTLITTIRALMEEKVTGGDLNGWQPIETAPKDGTEIDVWCASAGGFRIPSVIWEDRYGAFFSAEEGVLGDDISHWMPLPQPPANRSKGDA